MALKIGRHGEGASAGHYVLGSEDDRVSWGAIFAGAACALALQAMFTLFTASIGLELVDDGDASGAGWGSGLFFALTAIASMFAGGSIAGRLAGVSMLPSAVLHGVVVWALVTLAAVWLGVSATGALLNTAGQAVTSVGSATGSVLSSAGQAAGSAVSAITPNLDDLEVDDLESIVPPSIEADIRSVLGEDASPAEVRGEVRAITDQIVDRGEVQQARQILVGAGRRMLANPGEAGAIFDTAVERLTAENGPLGEQQFDELQGVLEQRYGITPEQSAEFVERWRTEFVEARDETVAGFRQTYDVVAEELNDAAETAAEAAQTAASATASAAWWTGLGIFIGLIAAAIGAALGRPEDIADDRPATRV